MNSNLRQQIAARKKRKRARRDKVIRVSLRKPLNPGRALDAATDKHLIDCTMEAVVKLYQKPKTRPDGTKVSAFMSEPHRLALTSIAGRMSHLITGHAEHVFGRGADDPIRLARGLTAGGGKTLVAKCFMAGIVHTERPYSVVYAASEVAALCDVYNDLIGDLEISPDDVGIYHTLGKKAGIAATPMEEIHQKKILLVTHNLVRTGAANLHRYNQYGPDRRPRDLLIHDESLLVSDAMSLRSIAVRNAHSHVKNVYEDGGCRDRNLEPVVDYIGDCQGRLIDNLPTIGKNQKVTVRLPNIEDYQSMSVLSAVNALPRGTPAAAKSLIEGSQCTLRIVREASHAAAWFVPRVPDELKRVMVLDASYMIRSLTRRGTNIERDTTEVHPQFDYRGVTIEYFKHRAGRSYIEDHECSRPRTQRPLAKNIATWIKDTVPAGEQVIIWTFKERKPGPDIPTKLRETLEHHGLGPVSIGEPKNGELITILTHGKSRGSNKYAAAKYVAVYGVFEPDKGITGGLMMGQSKDEKTDLSDLENVYSDEVLHELYQELSRGNVRNINRGRAGEMRVFVGGWLVNTLAELGSEHVFPGATMIHRTDLEPRTTDNDQYVKTARAVIDTLTKTDAGTDKVSSRSLSETVDATKKVWELAMKALSDDVDTTLKTELSAAGWQRHGRGFKRISQGVSLTVSPCETVAAAGT